MAVLHPITLDAHSSSNEDTKSIMRASTIDAIADPKNVLSVSRPKSILVKFTEPIAQRGNQTFSVESKSPEQTEKHAFALLGLAIATKGELSSFNTSDPAAVHEPKSVDKT